MQAHRFYSYHILLHDITVKSLIIKYDSHFYVKLFKNPFIPKWGNILPP